MHPFVIQSKGLKTGRSEFEWHADAEFFESFENSEILAADVDIHVEVLNEDFEIEVKCRMEGTVTVSCDRCLAPLVLPVETSFEDENVYDLSQDIYDYICLSLPMQRVHPDGECDEDTIKYLSK